MKYRVTLSTVIDVEANNTDHAEVVALEYFGYPKMDIVEVEPLNEDEQPELF